MADRQPNFALLLVLAWVVAMLQLVTQHWGETAQTLLDTDDAMRLVQMRDWLAGQGWYDLHQARLEPPIGYDSHWSRLIDAGLAALLWFFDRFTDPAMAERLMRTVWPMLWLLPAIGGAAAIAWRIAGRDAALIALLFAALGFQAFFQFRPGRIDHHNVQIALSMLLVAATVWADRVQWAAAAAGGITALALAVGLECLPYLAICGIAFALRFVFDAGAAHAARDYGLALAGGSVLAFFAIVGPSHWTQGYCDAIGLNWAALTVVAGLGLALASHKPAESWSGRLISMVVVGAAAVALFAVIEPRCLRGPYAQMDGALHAIWLDHVREMQPLFREMVKSPLTAIGIATFPAVAIVGIVLLLRDASVRRDPAFIVAVAAFAAAALTTIAAIKGYSYATWLAIPLVAVFALRLFAWWRIENLLPRVAVGVLLTPALVSIGAVTIADAASVGHAEQIASEREGCHATANYAALAKLPSGLVAGNIDLGPYLLALTSHSVLAAPYHRSHGGIAAAHAALSSPPEAARGILSERKVTYVIVCGERGPFGVKDPQLSASLWTKLRAGQAPDWLEPVALAGSPFAVYRVR